MDISKTRYRPIADGAVACPCHAGRHQRPHRSFPGKKLYRPRSNLKSAQVVSTELFGSQLQELCKENNKNLQYIVPELLLSDPCYQYGIKHWHPDGQHHSKGNEKAVAIAQYNPSVYENKGSFFCGSKTLDIKLYDPEEEDQSESPKKVQHNFCELCQSGVEHDHPKVKYTKEQIADKRLAHMRRNLRLSMTYDKPLTMKKPTEPEPVPTEGYYKLTITTGDAGNSGTDAKVHATLVGSQGKIKKHPLVKKRGSMQFKFNTSSKESFYIRGCDLGEKLKMVVLELDGPETKNGWFIKSVDVTDLATEVHWKAVCNKWLDQGPDEKSVKHIIKMKEETREIIEYDINIFTGDYKNAGSSANVSITLYGSSATSSRQPLKETINEEEEPFSRGTQAQFNIEIPDIGDLQKIRIEQDNTGAYPGWFLDQILIKDKTNEESYIFEYIGWIAEDKGCGYLWRELKPKLDKATKRKLVGKKKQSNLLQRNVVPDSTASSDSEDDKKKVKGRRGATAKSRAVKKEKDKQKETAQDSGRRSSIDVFSKSKRGGSRLSLMAEDPISEEDEDEEVNIKKPIDRRVNQLRPGSASKLKSFPKSSQKDVSEPENRRSSIFSEKSDPEKRRSSVFSEKSEPEKRRTSIFSGKDKVDKDDDKRLGSSLMYDDLMKGAVSPRSSESEKRRGSVISDKDKENSFRRGSSISPDYGRDLSPRTSVTLKPDHVNRQESIVSDREIRELERRRGSTLGLDDDVGSSIAGSTFNSKYRDFPETGSLTKPSSKNNVPFLSLQEKSSAGDSRSNKNLDFLRQYDKRSSPQPKYSQDF